MLFSWMDLAVLVGIATFAFMGWKKGLIKMGFRLLSFVLSIGLAWAFHPLLSGFLQKTPMYENLCSSIQPKVETEGISLMPMGAQNILEQGSFALTEYIAQIVLNILSFLVLLVVARVLLWFLRKILHFVASLPVIGFFNRLGGLAIGILEGLLVVYILLSVYTITPVLQNQKPLGYAVEQSVITRNLHLHNPVVKILTPKTEKEVLEYEEME